MNRPDMRSVIEIIATLSVIASLAIVAVEVRQNTAAVEAAAIQDLAAVTTDYLNAWATDDQIPGLLTRTWDGELAESFTDEENSRLLLVYISVLRAYEARFMQIQLGVLEDQILESMSGASGMFDDAWFAERWESTLRVNVGDDFAAFMEERYDLVAPPR